jgi:hypothetical protein
MRKLMFGLGGMLALACAPAMAIAPGFEAIAPRAPKKQIKAAKRARMAEAGAAPVYRRSKNAPPKRKLKANRLHVARRTRRRHRRARRAA